MIFFNLQEEKEGDWYVEPTSQEVGIDVPNEAPRQAEEVATPTLQSTKSDSQPSLHSQPSQNSPRSSMTILATQTSVEQEQPSRGSMRGRSATMATSSSLPRGSGMRGRSPGAKMADFHRSASPLLSAMSLQRSDSKWHINNIVVTPSFSTCFSNVKVLAAFWTSHSHMLYLSYQTLTEPLQSFISYQQNVGVHVLECVRWKAGSGLGPRLI